MMFYVCREILTFRFHCHAAMFHVAVMHLENENLYSPPLADPEILQRESEKGGGKEARKTMCQPRRHLSQMHTTNYIPFVREKRLIEKKFRANSPPLFAT